MEVVKYLGSVVREMDDIEVALLKLAKVLNFHKIKWAVGGSLLLKYFKIVEKANDIDILVSEKDYELTLKALADFQRVSVNSKSGFSSMYFEKFYIDKVGIDVMFGLTINNGHSVYHYPFEEESPVEIELYGEMIYYSSLIEWSKAYFHMIGREEKVGYIDDYLHDKYEVETLPTR